MKLTFTTKTVLALALMLVIQAPINAQEKDDQVTVKITRDVDGKPQTFEKTYASEDEMKADKELKEFVGDHGKMNFWFSDKPKVVWNDDQNGQNFFFNIGGDSTHHFKFLSDGDSLMKEFDFQISDLDEHMKEMEINIREHLKDFEKNGRMAFGYSDDGNFTWNFDDSLAGKIDDKIHMIFKDIDDKGDMDLMVVKRIKVSENVAEFGKKAEVKASNLLKLEDLKFYPNPAPNGRFKLKFNTPRQGELSIKIYNLSRKEVFNRYFDSYSGLYAETIDLSRQKEGLYLLEIQLDNKRLTRKITID